MFLMLSAALHVFGSVLSSFHGAGAFLLLPAALYTAFFFGLRQHVLWVIWLTLLCMLGGMAGTLLELSKASPVPVWVLWAILAADFFCAAYLVRALRQNRHAPGSEKSA